MIMKMQRHRRIEKNLNFKIFRQLLSASIAWVHSNEETKLRVEVHHIAISEYELRLPVFLGL